MTVGDGTVKLIAMSKADIIRFACVKEGCIGQIPFSLFDMEKQPVVVCPVCENEYNFSRELLDKMGKLMRLMRAVQEAEGILGNVNVAVDVHGHSVKIPYRLLLTRLNTLLSLDIQGHKVDFEFRIEPLEKELVR